MIKCWGSSQLHKIILGPEISFLTPTNSLSAVKKVQTWWLARPDPSWSWQMRKREKKNMRKHFIYGFSNIFS